MDSELQQLSKTDRNPVQETRYQELLRGANIAHTVENGKANVPGFGTGGNLATTEQFDAATGGAGISGAMPGGVKGFNQPSINLPQLYESYYNSSGIKNTEADLTAKTAAFNQQVANIKDNPYLSEGNMTGRISKLSDKFNADTANVKNDIAMKKADIETKLNLQSKQFDIESEQARQAMDQFNSLLGSGALDNASGEDIANLTRATGLSSSMIQSAIGVSKAKNAPKAEKVNTQIIQVDDGNEVSAVVINQDTGQIINKQVLGASTPTSAEVKAGLPGGGSTKEKKPDFIGLLKEDAKKGVTLSQIFSIYNGYLKPDQILQLYNSSSRYGKAKETPAQLAKYGVTQPKSTARQT